VHSMWWWVASVSVLAAALLLTAQGQTAGIADQLWYFASVLLLCPFVAALGARRPGIGAWLCFVVFPLVLVLEWPALSLLVTSEVNESLLLQTPAILGAFVVLVMGAGNYLGTRFTGPVLLFCVAEVCFFTSVSELKPGSINATTLRYTGSGFLIVAIVSLAFSLKNWTERGESRGLQRVWSDFCDSFGIVWSRRVAERFNLMVKREKLEVRIHNTSVMREKAGQPMDTAVNDREEQILRWILRRFVDPTWLDHRLTTNDNTKLSSGDDNDTGTN
ncbi:hypothetical protein OAH18_03425, partial [bacterium]|nr:hypothetical protein [bacterium]